jgi:hypothetical protein
LNKKAYINCFFNNYEVKGIDDLYYLKTQSFILAVTPCGLGLFVVFAGLGIVRLIHMKEYRQGFLICGVLGCILVSNIVTFVTWRYRLLNIVPLSLLAAHGLRFLHEKTRELFTFHRPVMTRIGTYGISVIFPLALCAWIAYSPVMEGEKKGFFMRSSTNDRLSMRAEKRLLQLEELESIQTDTAWVTWEKAFVLSSLQRHSEAYRLLNHLHEKGGSHPYGTYKYVVYLLWLGDYGQAIQLLKDISSQNPGLIPAVTRQLRGVEKEAYLLFVAPKLL